MKLAVIRLFAGLASASSLSASSLSASSLSARQSFSAAASASSCCSTLQSRLGSSKVILSSGASYNTTLSSFWSGQSRDDDPSCIVQPSSSADVSAAVQILTSKWCKFSVKSGGHMPWAGAASINGGIEIDLVNLSAVTLSSSNATAFLGPGARWGKVYDTLTPLGYGVAGGRDSTVGVGGLILGGGYSWFAAASGWVADSLVSVELVTGDGSIITASAISHPDLFLVLKGGGNNFGIVTKYEVKAFPFGDLWGGIMVYPRSTTAAQITAFMDFTANIKNDVSANMINIWSYQQATGADLILNCLEYTKPIAAPAPYNELLAIQPLIASTMRITNLTDLTTELADATTQNLRYTFITLTFKASAAFYQQAITISDSYLAPHRNSPNLTWSLLFQPVPRIVQDHSVAAGGNIMGIDRNAGDLMLFLLYITWQDAADDDVFNAAGRACVADIKAAGNKLGVNVPFIYMNYADKPQDVLSGYGTNNLRKMAAASRKYDPNGVFQNLVPGGWKISM